MELWSNTFICNNFRRTGHLVSMHFKVGHHVVFQNGKIFKELRSAQ